MSLRDLLVFLFLVGSIVLAFRKPWLGVLALAVFNHMAPHRFTWGFMLNFPVYQILFVAVAAATLMKWSERQPLPRDWRIPTFFFLWSFFLVTTLDAEVPRYAWEQFEKVSKIYLPFIFMLWLIDTREKLYYFIATLTASLGLIAVKGGLFAIATGFNYRVYGPSKTQLGGNNEFAIAALMIIPFLILLSRETKNKWVRRSTLVAVPLCMASALSSHSRGAFLSLGVMAVVLLWNSNRKWLVAPLMVVGVVLVVPQLPEHWFSRMETIQTYEEDGSAMSRIRTWTDGWNYAQQHPLTGAGFNGWIAISERDWHNSYIEMMAEHGFVGFFLWFSLLFGSMWNLTMLARKVGSVPELQWIRNYSLMVRASLIAYAAGTMFLGGAYWAIFYQIVFIAVLVRQFALQDIAAYHARSPGERVAAPDRLSGNTHQPAGSP